MHSERRFQNMKTKTITLLGIACVTFATTGCFQKPVIEYSSLKVLAPTGAPAVAMSFLAYHSNLETTSNPAQGLIPMFKTNTYDVIVAPTQGGLTQIVKQQANYKIAATITFGNFYIVATGKDDNNTLDAGDSILIFQENDIPGKVFNYIYKDAGLDVTAVAAVSDTKLVIENGGTLRIDESTVKEFDYIYTAQPVVSATNSTIFINVQDAFKAKSGGKTITQASIFVNNNADKEKVNMLLSDAENYINSVIEDPSVLKSSIEFVGSTAEQQDKFGVPGAMATKVTNLNNGFSLGYKNALSIKDEIQSFVNLLTNNAIGELSEEVFYQ